MHTQLLLESTTTTSDIIYKLTSDLDVNNI